MLENEGHWLKLMRTANLPTDANICLRISGEEIVCTVTKDVNKEVELKVTCRIAEDAQEELKTKRNFLHSLADSFHSNEKVFHGPGTALKDCESPGAMLDLVVERTIHASKEMSSKNCAERAEKSPKRQKLVIRNFSSDSESEGNEAQDEVSSSTVHESPSSDVKQNESTEGNSSGEFSTSETNRPMEVETPQLQSEDEKTYKCTLCNFVSGELPTLEKHIQSHRFQTIRRTSKLTNAKSFCDACKIQFMSVDTYHVHKQLYCKSRHEKDEISGSPIESASCISTAAFKPGADTVIIRSGVSGGGGSSIIQPQAIYAAISTNPLILIPCSLESCQGLVPQNGMMPTGAPGIVVQTGIACPAIVEKPDSLRTKDENPPSRKTSHPIMNFNSDSVDRSFNNSSSLRKRKMSEGDVLNLKKPCSNEPVSVLDSDMASKDSESSIGDQDGPLDLSLKKEFSILPGESILKRKNSVASIERSSPPYRNTSDSESPPRSSTLYSRVVISPASSYSGDSTHCYPPHVPVVLSRHSQALSERLSPVPPVLQPDASVEKTVPPPGMPPPPKLLKQGNNICEECHIVFYKYDNYLAHKKHYCAYRRRQLSAIAAAAAHNQDHSSDDNNSNHSGLNESSTSYQSDDVGKSSTLRRMDHPVDHFRSVITKSAHSVFCCDACGVKFSTSDNLNAHQTYYCIKKADSAMSKVAAARGDNSNSPKTTESPFSGPEEWKCNYCEMSCASYDLIRRHLLSHSELRGFRCIVCGYKGNTLRGMRSHACEHLRESTTSIEEFVSANVIAENGVMPILPPPMDRSDDDSDHSRELRINSKRERTQSESMQEQSLSFKREISPDLSEKHELASQRKVDNIQKDHVPKATSPVKMESHENSPGGSGSSNQDTVNPLAFCDVVIKTENDQSSSEESSREEDSESFIKFEPEPESDSSDRPREVSKSPPGKSTSVIRRASDIDKSEERRTIPQSSKRKNKNQSEQNSDVKYCKSCDISFYHMSNFIAHKKFYCVSRVIQNCRQETAPVQ